MEVDQVSYGKSKGKNKGKSSKGKKGGWFNIPFGGKYGNQKGGKNKGKSKGKKGGKHKGKGKSGKGKSGKGKGYNNQNHNACRLCGQVGHWGNECPTSNGVNQVNENQNSAASAETTSVGGATSRRTSIGSGSTTSSQTTATRPGNFRRVKLYNVATPPITTPECFEMESVDGEEEWFSTCMVKSVDVEWFSMDGGEIDEPYNQCNENALYQWYGDCNHQFDRLHVSKEEIMDRYHVRAVPMMDPQLIVLDSGADTSLLPKTMCEKGFGKRLGKTVLQDAQGARLETFGKRSAQLECEGNGSDLVVIEDDFVVASVQSPLISLGRLLQKGWTLTPSSAEAGINLVDPDKGCEAPLCFKKNSLALYAHIRVVNLVEETLATSCPITTIVGDDEPMSEMDEDKEMMVVQTIVEPKAELLDRIFKRGWTTTEAGNPYIIVPNNVEYMDPSMLFPWSEWPRRRTLVQRADFKWGVIEHCVPYFTKITYTGQIEECQGVPAFVITVLHKHDEPLSVFGSVVADSVQAGGSHISAESFPFAEEPQVPMEMQEGLKPEELAQMDAERGLFSNIENFQWTFDNRDALTVGSTIVKKDSSIALLRTAAGSWGSPKVVKGNPVDTTLENQQLCQDANRLYREENQVNVQAQSVPRQPTKQERILHELTHLPFRSWCSFCVSCKSKMDSLHHVNPQPERREYPVIQLDYAYGKVTPGIPAATILVGIDCQSKMLTAFPAETKGTNLRGQAEHITRFSLMLNHVDKIEIVADSEPTMLDLLQKITLLTQHLGFETVVTHGLPGDKRRTAQVERAIQTLRRQASTLFEMAEQKCEVKLPGDHALIPWSYIHGAWTLNRFHCHSATKVSPFELVFGRTYAGKVACFGEVVMVLHRRGLNCKHGPPMGSWSMAWKDGS